MSHIVTGLLLYAYVAIAIASWGLEGWRHTLREGSGWDVAWLTAWPLAALVWPIPLAAICLCATGWLAYALVWEACAFGAELLYRLRRWRFLRRHPWAAPHRCSRCWGRLYRSASGRWACLCRGGAR